MITCALFNYYVKHFVSKLIQTFTFIFTAMVTQRQDPAMIMVTTTATITATASISNDLSPRSTELLQQGVSVSVVTPYLKNTGLLAPDPACRLNMGHLASAVPPPPNTVLLMDEAAPLKNMERPMQGLLAQALVRVDSPRNTASQELVVVTHLSLVFEAALPKVTMPLARGALIPTRDLPQRNTVLQISAQLPPKNMVYLLKEVVRD